eukprot:5409429-Alexandrium_andersonii.AAC.1
MLLHTRARSAVQRQEACRKWRLHRRALRGSARGRSQDKKRSYKAMRSQQHKNEPPGLALLCTTEVCPRGEL